MRESIVKKPSWWNRRSGTERSLILVAAVAVIVGLALAVALVVVLLRIPNPLCITPGCVKTASKVLSYIDTSIDPCDDFYDFACGNFVKNIEIPNNLPSVTAFTSARDRIKEQLKKILEEPYETNELRSFQLAKKLYRGCLNETVIENRGLQPMKDMIVRLGGWPVLEEDKWVEKDWMQSVYKFRSVGYSIAYFINFYVSTDSKNTSRYAMQLDQADLGLPRSLWVQGIENTIMQAYYKYMIEVAVLFGANRKRAESEMLDVLKFHINLANISIPPEDRRDSNKLYNPMTINELQQKYPSIQWLDYFNNIMTVVKANTDETVIVLEPNFIKEFEILVQETPKRTLTNYAIWRAISDSVGWLTIDLRTLQLSWATAVIGVTEPEPRWKRCAGDIANKLDLAVGALFVRKYFDEQTKIKAQEMVHDIQTSFKHIVRNSAWMDEKTKKSALEKAEAIVTHIAYPDELLDDKKIDDFYKTVEIHEDKYMESLLNVEKFGYDYFFNNLRKPVNKTDWVLHGNPANVNAYYRSLENSIELPAGVLQGNFFSSDRPHYMNYGAIGFVIGHELTHGFDDEGRQYDKNGELVEWWTPKIAEAFKNKAQCIIEQYGNFTVPEIDKNLNGINTQGENIADNGGIKLAYLAYSHWLQRNNGIESLLPGLPYTARQLFWISAASTWCSKSRPENLRATIDSMRHAPGRFRVIGPNRNMEEFAKDFHCPVGSKMNPKHKCHVW